jgi:hypothetical protein
VDGPKSLRFTTNMYRMVWRPVVFKLVLSNSSSLQEI